MKPDWRIDLLIFTAGFTVERTGHNLRGESIFRSLTGGNIPKSEGRQRRLGIAAREDKIVQQAVVTILNQILRGRLQGLRKAGATTGWMRWQKQASWRLDT